MFAEHQPIIEKFAKKNEDNFFQVLQFVLLTIQQPLWRLPSMMKDANENGLQCRDLWGVKADGWRFAKANKVLIYENAMAIDHAYPDPEAASRELLIYFASLPGLGLVKGGFLAQLAFGLCGCLDTHNVLRFNLTPSQVKASAFKGLKTVAGKQHKVDMYLELCEELGGVAGLWDSWCAHVHSKSRFGYYYRDAHHVSMIHCEAFGLAA
jgi:hypothetical protein